MKQGTLWIAARLLIAMSLIAATVYLLGLPETTARVSAIASMLTIVAMMAKFYFDDSDDEDQKP